MTPTRSRFLRPVLLAALALAAIPIACAQADVIRLRNGETLKCRIVLEKTNEQVLVVEDYVTGGIREFSWEALDPEQANETKLTILGTGTRSTENVVKCDVITYRLDGGATTEIRGIVLREEGGFLLVQTKAASKDHPLRIDKSRVVSREEGEGSQEEFEDAGELYARRKAEIDPQDARHWMIVAQYGESVGAYVEAKEAYEQAASDETYLQRASAQAGATRMTAVIADGDARKTLADLRIALAFAQFQKVREGIDGFGAKHPTASEPVKKQLEALKGQFTKSRADYFAGRAGKEFVDLLTLAIRKHVSPKDAAFNDVQAWTRSDATNGAFADLTTRFQLKDPAITGDEVKTFFDARPKRPGQWYHAKYGSGSFLIEPPKVKPPTGGNKAPAQKSGKKNSGPVGTIEIPKPPTRDEWWAHATSDDRTQFWLATIAEKSGLFEVAPQREKSPCPTCNGEGLEHKMLSTGSELVYLCHRCGGAQNDLTVKFR